MNGTVLIVEDDPVLMRGLKDNFAYEGYRVQTATDGEAGLDLALSARPDLVILDLMLPKVNGYEICRCIRAEKLEMPILMLTAKGQESDIVLGLKLGADDYMTKPFSIRELLARAEALLRRWHPGGAGVLEFGECRFDAGARTLTRGGVEVPLSPKEFELLAHFVAHAGRALSRESIMSNVWGCDRSVTLRSIDRFVNALRQKIERDPSTPQHLRTVREFGYKFAV